MNSQNNNQNSSDSFEEFRRQLGLDETESSDISLFDELMNTHKRQAENEIKASPKVVFDAGDDDAPSSDDASVGVGRRIVNEDLITVASDDKSKKTSKKKDANLKRQKKKAEKEQKRELANSERENKRFQQKSAKSHEKVRREEEKEAARQRKLLEKTEKKTEKNSSNNQSAVPPDAAPVVSRFSSDPSFIQDSLADENISEIERTVESADSDDINNIVMFEYDPDNAPSDKKGFDKFIYNTFPNKKDPVKEKLRKTISVLSVLVIIGSFTYFGVLYYQKHQNVAQAKSLKRLVTEVPAQSSEEETINWEKIKAQYPDVDFPVAMNIKYAHLYAINPEFVGWLSVPNTPIDVQVVKAENNEKYLKSDFYGNYSRYGCPFMDFRDNIRNLSMNTIIYGHHMRDGLIFAQLSKYLEPAGFEESPVISFSTLFGDYTFKIYAVFITNSKPEDDNGYLFNFIFNHLTSDEAYLSYIAALDERKLYDTGVDIAPGDKLITLSTCTYEFDDARLVVVGRMVRPGENPTSHGAVTVNENPRYPAAWYASKKIDNPFENADKWYPS